jgi:N-acetylglutamate synthase-like GNAT family acetyltransferase
MAEHRGFKLVKSRKRKPGIGDFGKFGLTDLDGKPLLGIGAHGLEASADDIEAYLRTGAANTWKASAETTASRLPPPPRRARDDADEDHDVQSVVKPRAEPKPAGQSNRAADPSSTVRHKTGGQRKTPRGRTQQRADTKAVTRESVRRAPTPAPKLVIRIAKSADAATLVPLLHELSGLRLDELGVARNLKIALKADAGMVVAQLGEIIGCCAWAIIPTIQHGPVGRLTLLLVSKAHRRKGIATALLNAAIMSLRTAGCARLEAMSDIEVRNAHNFFRTSKFEQTSYRFARTIEPE